MASRAGAGAGGVYAAAGALGAVNDGGGGGGSGGEGASSGVIARLATADINRICSGQVITDLATAVKELVENALDAQATTVQVKLVEYGAELIEVTDNGRGIDPADYRAVALKSATSKLATFDDLYTVSSFGFRGEALASLCELAASVTIVTRTAAQAVGAELSYNRLGELVASSPVPCPVGTTVRVTHLFSTMPVRHREFLKALRKQHARMLAVLQGYAIIATHARILVSNLPTGSAAAMEAAHSVLSRGVAPTQVAAQVRASADAAPPTATSQGARGDDYGFASTFSAVTGATAAPGRPPAATGSRQQLLVTSGSKSLRGSIVEVLGTTFAATLEPISVDLDVDDEGAEAGGGAAAAAAAAPPITAPTGGPAAPAVRQRIVGLVSKAGQGIGRSSSERQFVFINGRPVDVPAIVRTLNETWRQFELSSKPACVLDLQLRPRTFDVNVTPNKREVLLVHEGAILAALKAAVQAKWEPARRTFAVGPMLSSAALAGSGGADGGVAAAVAAAAAGSATAAPAPRRGAAKPTPLLAPEVDLSADDGGDMLVPDWHAQGAPSRIALPTPAAKAHLAGPSHGAAPTLSASPSLSSSAPSLPPFPARAAAVVQAASGERVADVGTPPAALAASESPSAVLPLPSGRSLDSASAAASSPASSHTQLHVRSSGGTPTASPIDLGRPVAADESDLASDEPPDGADSVVDMAEVLRRRQQVLLSLAKGGARGRNAGTGFPATKARADIGTVMAAKRAAAAASGGPRAATIVDPRLRGSSQGGVSDGDELGSLADSVPASGPLPTASPAPTLHSSASVRGSSSRSSGGGGGGSSLAASHRSRLPRALTVDADGVSHHGSELGDSLSHDGDGCTHRTHRSSLGAAAGTHHGGGDDGDDDEVESVVLADADDDGAAGAAAAAAAAAAASIAGRKRGRDEAVLGSRADPADVHATPERVRRQVERVDLALMRAVYRCRATPAYQLRRGRGAASGSGIDEAALYATWDLADTAAYFGTEAAAAARTAIAPGLFTAPVEAVAAASAGLESPAADDTHRSAGDGSAAAVEADDGAGIATAARIEGAVSAVSVVPPARTRRSSSRRSGQAGGRARPAAALADEGAPSQAEGVDAGSAAVDADAADATAAEAAMTRVLTKAHFHELSRRVVGQFNLGFIVARVGADLFIMDQHACDEKAQFEFLQEHTVLHEQRLLVPRPIDVTASEEHTIASHADTFRMNGFHFTLDTTAATGRRLRLTAIPFSRNIAFGDEDVRELASLIAEASAGTVIRLPKATAMFASRACRSAIMIGTALTQDRMRKVVAGLADLAQPWNCPHGRPTMRHLVDLSHLTLAMEPAGGAVVMRQPLLPPSSLEAASSAAASAAAVGAGSSD